MPTLALLRANIGAILAGITIAVLALAFTVQTVRIDGLHWQFKAGAFTLPFLNVEGWKEMATKAQAALQEVKAAQPQAAAAQSQANHEPAEKSAAIARNTDAQTPDYLAHVAAAAVAHAVSVARLSPAPAAEGVACKADLPGTDRIAQGDDDTAGSPDMVSVARADWLKINAEAALRVQLYQAGQEMIAEGIAVASDAPASPAPEAVK
ncbi:hypothetical protein [Novosphingobium sp.]|uniref:hypothetical protein n=1 Tax=Novosphingobium sp. TaxID=1874826 RepID=UPI0031D8ABA3